MIHLALACGLLAGATAATVRPADPQRGYELLISKPYLPADFDQETFDATWHAWPDALRQAAEVATPKERRQLAFSRYGLTSRPADRSGRPLQYVVDARGNWTMNCFACHGGKVLGQTIPGLPNSHLALETLTTDIRKAKLRLRKQLTRMDIGSLFMPLGRNNGTTNAVMFGVALMAYRDPDLNFHPYRRPPEMVHHDLDAPPWWHFKKRQYLYADGFAPKNHRALMQFMLVRENGPGDFARWEDDFRDVYAYLESLEAPPYPFAVDRRLAGRGERIFMQSCADCHGTYGRDETYPGRVVPIAQLGTDPVRLEALRPENRASYARSWFHDRDSGEVVLDPEGYVAPPLDGIWASAPYFHNGSVPTLWHVLHPDARPSVWRRSENGYDPERVGLEVREYDRWPPAISLPDEARQVFDTGRSGKSAAGHNFPGVLSETERRAVLEYLKTL
jgi:hypothetical protein